MSNHDFWSAPTRAEPELDVNHVFANFRNTRRVRGISENELRERMRRNRGEDRMRGVVVEVRRSRLPRRVPEPEAEMVEAPSPFRF